MRSSLNPVLILLLTGSLAAAQSSTTAKPPTPQLPTAITLPSEATVDSFLQQTFGYEPQVSWKISSIRPAPVPGLAEVDVILATRRASNLAGSTSPPTASTL